jgi:hypothetical protein
MKITSERDKTVDENIENRTPKEWLKSCDLNLPESKTGDIEAIGMMAKIQWNFCVQNL